MKYNSIHDDNSTLEIRLFDAGRRFMTDYGARAVVCAGQCGRPEALTTDDLAGHKSGGSGEEDHYAAPGSRLTDTYLAGYTSINSQ
jgi:hypothetical protein